MQTGRLPIRPACHAVVPGQCRRVEGKNGQGFAVLRFDRREQCDHVRCREDGFVDFQRRGFDADGRTMRRSRKNGFECLSSRSSASWQNPVVASQLTQRNLSNLGERVLAANEDGIWVREQKFFGDVGRPCWPPKYPKQDVEIAGTQGVQNAS